VYNHAFGSNKHPRLRSDASLNGNNPKAICDAPFGCCTDFADGQTLFYECNDVRNLPSTL
jgi:hypothetical protein